MGRHAKPGTVYLVGAGPGDPELITVRGHRLLRDADIVVYDRLVHPELVEDARSAVERIYVGKAPGRPSTSQHAINALLVEKAREGWSVVRLKGGDPFVFARGGEEAQVLREAGVTYEVVPGITSATSVPAYAGIPMTHRKVSRAFTVVTGHSLDLSGTNLDWETLAKSDTLVILMGLGRLPRIALHLIEGGRSPETPAAVIQSGSTTEQKAVYGTLETIAERASHLSPPATIIVGETAAFGPELAWFHPGPSSRASFPVSEPLPGRPALLPLSA